MKRSLAGVAAFLLGCGSDVGGSRPPESSEASAPSGVAAASVSASSAPGRLVDYQQIVEVADPARRGEVEQALGKARPRMDRCVRDLLERDPALAGSAEATFQVTGGSARLDSAEWGAITSTRAERCLIETLASAPFEPSSVDLTFTVKLAFFGKYATVRELPADRTALGTTEWTELVETATSLELARSAPPEATDTPLARCLLPQGIVPELSPAWLTLRIDKAGAATIQRTESDLSRCLERVLSRVTWGTGKERVFSLRVTPNEAAAKAYEEEIARELLAEEPSSETRVRFAKLHTFLASSPRDALRSIGAFARQTEDPSAPTTDGPIVVDSSAPGSANAATPPPGVSSLPTVRESEPGDGGMHHVIRRVVRSGNGRFQFCYETQLAQDPAFEALTRTTFGVSPEGKVTDVKVLAFDLVPPGGAPTEKRVPNFTKCVEKAFLALEFPTTVASFRVTYPMTFVPPAPPLTGPRPKLFDGQPFDRTPMLRGEQVLRAPGPTGGRGQTTWFVLLPEGMAVFTQRRGGPTGGCSERDGDWTLSLVGVDAPTCDAFWKRHLQRP